MRTLLISLAFVMLAGCSQAYCAESVSKDGECQDGYRKIAKGGGVFECEAALVTGATQAVNKNSATQYDAQQTTLPGQSPAPASQAPAARYQ